VKQTAKTAKSTRAASSSSSRAAGPVSPRTRVLVVSGPNLQLLGLREPSIYGRETLTEIHARVAARALELELDVDTFQSNHEGDLLDRIGRAPADGFAGILLNAGAYTHTSLALYDALRAVALPCVEVHLSNPEAREAYRHVSRVAPACIGKVAGFGGDSYVLALDALVRWLERTAVR
jgi:3-dehydroquinate dehydratase-2